MTLAISVLLGLVGAYTDFLGNQQSWLKSKLSQPENGWYYSVLFLLLVVVVFQSKQHSYGDMFWYKDATRPKRQVCFDCELFFFFSRFYTNFQIMLEDDLSQEWGRFLWEETFSIGKGVFFPSTCTSLKNRTYSPYNRTNKLLQRFRF